MTIAYNPDQASLAILGFIEEGYEVRIQMTNDDPSQVDVGIYRKGGGRLVAWGSQDNLLAALEWARRVLDERGKG